MNIQIEKRKTKTLDISLNAQGKKLVYTAPEPKTPIQITIQKNDDQNNTTIPSSTTNVQQNNQPPNLNNQLERIDTNSSYQLPTSKIVITPSKPKKQNQDKFHYTPDNQQPPQPPSTPNSPQIQSEPKIDEPQQEAATRDTYKKHFIFSESTIYQKIPDTELTNNYKEAWPSIESYIKIMHNLAVENFFYPLRTHLAELKNNQLDPRDLYLYEKVKISPNYEYDDRSEYDIFVSFSVRAPNFIDGKTVKPRKLREIDWTFTERLSNRSLLFFSFSPLMEKIEAVAISRAAKGTIENNIVPISILQGRIEVGKEYYVFEPIDHWNCPFYDNLLNTSEETLPENLIRSIVSLDFSNNSVNKDDCLFCVPGLFKDMNDFKQEKYDVKSIDADEDVKFYVNEFITTFENKKTVKEAFVQKTLKDLCTYLRSVERQRGNIRQFEEDSEVVKKVSREIKKYAGFMSLNAKWPFDDFNEEEFRAKCAVDHEQYKAIKYSLNHHLTLVNGAPGTGKTYLACELVKLLIRSQYEHPIIVVTYKNVSLDGFLDNVAGFLEENEVDFVRIGGKPRTENKFILSKHLENTIPHDIQHMKSQIIFLISMRVMMNDCLKELETKALNEIQKTIINEFDKAISIRRIMFNMFPIYTRQEEKVITNLFNPLQFIPSAESYFNCWVLGDDYYNEIKSLSHRSLNQKYEELLKEFNSYLNRSEGYKNSEIIDEIIGSHFYGDDKKLTEYLITNKQKIISKDTSVIFNIFNSKYNSYYDDLDNDRELNHLLYYIEDENKDLLSFELKKTMIQKLTQLFSNKDKLNSFKQFLNEMSTIMEEHTRTLKEKSQEKMKEFEIAEIERFGNELSKKKLIAMTATRAAQYKSCLDNSDAQFMIFEEAGELTESMAFSIIPKTIEHLVMIGDYRQLRPTVEHVMKFPPYNYSISLFEKEVIHGKAIKSDNLFTLSIQRRMHPEISSLLRHVFYNDNKDDEKFVDDLNTEKLEKPIGFPGHMQFWMHDFEEEADNQRMRSHVNIKEAQICAYLFMMMLCRGYKSTEVTIISLYKGQKRQIERELVKLIDYYYNDDRLSLYDAFDFENDLPDVETTKDFDKLVEIRKSLVSKYVKCLDDFQGEENEVIIISLTRSEKPGFVKNENRALVTLSRARQMEFVIGNRKVFGSENCQNPLWQRITKSAANFVRLNGIACLSCQNHSRQSTTIILSKLSDFVECRFNCCVKKCNANLSCGHICHLPCHFHTAIFNTKPKLKETFTRRYFCDERCLHRCKKGHQCEEMCGNCAHFGCPPCKHKCDGKCKICGRNCGLLCCHEGDCMCLFNGYCADCHTKICELHGKIRLWNKKELVCPKCFKKRAEMKKYGKM